MRTEGYRYTQTAGLSRRGKRMAESLCRKASACADSRHRLPSFMRSPLGTSKTVAVTSDPMGLLFRTKGKQ
jgi:hypothetical protein